MTSSRPPAAEPEPASERQPELELMPAAAAAVFGEQVEPAATLARLLATTGVVRGAVGPHEPARIWTRHLLNCAVVTELFEPDVRVVDVGSGAGLPGLAMAIRRPDLRVDLVEPMARRYEFLTELVVALELTDRVRVVRGRAEDAATRAAVGGAAWVTARAVAPLDRLVRWCLPLLAADGRAALLKGATAAAELAEHRAAVMRAGGVEPQLVQCGVGLVEPPGAVVRMGVRQRNAAPVGRATTRRRGQR